VVRAGAGVNTIDLVSASEHGVRVCNCPGMNAAAVAELTLGLILSLDRNIPDNVADLRAGVWNKARYAKATGLRGRTLGVVGLGNIGAQVAALGQAFGMDVICWTYPPEDDTPERMGIPRYDTPEEVAANCDVLTAHLALNDATRGFISRAVLEALPDGAFVINTSRAKIVDEEALLELLDSKGLRAGLDLFSGEPAAKTGTIDDPLAKHPNVYGTHHIGASTAQAQLAVGEEACRVIEVFEAEGVAVNCVNPAE